MENSFKKSQFVGFSDCCFLFTMGSVFFYWLDASLPTGGETFSENAMKMITSYFFIIGIVGVLLAGFLSDWLVIRKGLARGRKLSGALTLSMVAFSFIVAAITSNNTVVIISLFIGQLFYSFNVIVAFSTCIDIGGDRVGTVAGIVNFFGQTGAFLLAITFGKIIDITHSFDTPMFVVAGVVFAGSIFWSFVDASKPIQSTVQKLNI